ncbi:hypothetical protein JCM10207_004329 [Rhodosporidiobolus poonsookiae]
MADGLDLLPLHNLYQTISPSSHPDLPHPLLALAQLRRKPPSKRAQGDQAQGGQAQGEVEWVVALGGKGKALSAPEAGAGAGKKRKAATSVPDEWWEASLCAREVDELMQQVDGSAITPEAMVRRVKAKWMEGCLDVTGYEGPGPEHRGGIELTIRVTDSLPLSIVLTPCDEAPLSLLSILAQVIPPFLSCTADRASCDAAKKERDALSTKVGRLERQLRDLTEEKERERKRARNAAYSGGGGSGAGGPKRQKSGGAEFGRRPSSQEGASQASQGGGGYDGGGGMPSVSQGSPQKKVIPGQTHRGALRPGDPGYAGNANRAGRQAEAEFDSDSDSD